MQNQTDRTSRTLVANRRAILDSWIEAQEHDSRIRRGLVNRQDLARQSEEFLEALATATAKGNLDDIDAPAFAPVKDVLNDIALRRMECGFSPLETAASIICFKDAWLPFLSAEYAGEPEQLNREVVRIFKLIDTLALLTYDRIVRESEARRRQAEETVRRQTLEILELSTPVVQVWDGIVAAPLIGSLDSARTQQFMERLLNRIVETNSPVALVDITGVPTIDTQTAQHLIETISAVRLLGAQVVLTGVRPSIAQTLVHLGIDLSDITTRSSLAGGLRVALGILDLEVVSKNGRQ